MAGVGGDKMKRAIGLMSGTSADGVDAALIETDGVKIKALGPRHFIDYAGDERAQILTAMQAVKSAETRQEREEIGERISPLVTTRHSEAVQALMEIAGVTAGDVDVIGFHGQTLFHDPAEGYSLQVGDAGRLARETGIAVVHQMRQADLAAGGEGAPLVPVYHRALAQMSGLELPVAVVNIGGVANVTYISEGDEADLLAFDIGPGNVLIDEWVGVKTGARFDDKGQLAMGGEINEAALGAMLSAPYFTQTPPKSLDRYDFDFSAVAGLSPEDGAATLTELTARAIAGAQDFMAACPKAWVIVGGGYRNEFLMARLRALLSGAVHSGAGVEWSPGYVEAEAFGFLAVRHLIGLPLTFPGTTGVRSPQVGGELAKV